MHSSLTGLHYFRLVEDAFCRAACSQGASLAAYGFEKPPLEKLPPGELPPEDPSGWPPNLPCLLSTVRRSCPESELGPKDLYGPARSEGYADLVVDAIGRAWTWRGDAASSAEG